MCRSGRRRRSLATPRKRRLESSPAKPRAIGGGARVGSNSSATTAIALAQPYARFAKPSRYHANNGDKRCPATSSAPLQSYRDGESLRPQSYMDFHWPFASLRQRAKKWKFRHKPSKVSIPRPPSWLTTASSSSTRTGPSSSVACRRFRETAARHVRAPPERRVAPLVHREPAPSFQVFASSSIARSLPWKRRR